MSIKDESLFAFIKAKAPTIFIIGTFLIYEVKVYFYFIIFNNGLVLLQDEEALCKR